MKTRTRHRAKAGDVRRITLKLSSALTNDPCAICGARCDPGGLDYFDKTTDGLVCDSCAKKHAPEMVAIQKAAYDFAEGETSLMLDDLRCKVRDAISEPVEKRIMKVLDEICGVADDVPF